MYILFTYLKTLYSLSQFFAYLCVGRSVNTGVCWAHNVLYQMGAQRGVAWGLSPVSEMLIMNINKSYTYTHTHITAPVCLAKQIFQCPSLPYEFVKKPSITIPPGQHWFLWLCFLYHFAWKINFSHLVSTIFSFSIRSRLHKPLWVSLAPASSVQWHRISIFLFFPLRVGLLSQEWNKWQWGSFLSLF